MIIIDNISPLVPGFNVVVSTAWEQISCSYEILFRDISTISHPSYDNIRIEYYYEDLLIGSSKETETAVYNFKEEGNKDIKQVLTIFREDPRNPNTQDEILYQAENTLTVILQEWQPQFKFPEGNFYYPKQEIDITPSIIELNNNVCGILLDPNSGYKGSLTSASGFYNANYYATYNVSLQTLTYELYQYDQDISEFLLIPDAKKTFIVSTENPLDYIFNYEASQLGAYKLVATLQNCCESVTDEIIFSTVDTLRIYRNCQTVIECDDCTGYTLENTTISDIVVEIYDQVADKKIHELTVPSLQSISYNFTDDGAYRFTWTTLNQEVTNVIIINKCHIDTCYVNLLKMILCRQENTPCCDDRFLDNRLANIQALYQTFLSLIEPYTNLERRFSNVDITQQLQDFLEIGKIRDQLLEFCDVCKRGCASCFDWNNGTCL